MAVRPLRDRILVERVEEQEQRVGGIIIPDTAKEKPQQGRIVAVGRGRVNDKGDVFPLDVKVGDLVLIGKYSGTEIKLDGKEYTILREDEVLGVLEGVVERFGAGRVLFASGFPRFDPRLELLRVRWAPNLDERSRAAILAGNAERLLGLSDAGNGRG